MLREVTFFKQFNSLFRRLFDSSKLTRSKNIAQKKFTLVPGDVVCKPDEVFALVDVENDLSMCKDSYLELISRSS